MFLGHLTAFYRDVGQERFYINAPACNGSGRNTRSHTMDESNQVSGRSINGSISCKNAGCS